MTTPSAMPDSRNRPDPDHGTATLYKPGPTGPAAIAAAHGRARLLNHRRTGAGTRKLWGNT